MQDQYLTVDDVTDIPGSRLAALFGVMDPVRQQTWLARASRRVDAITRQDGGLYVQTGKQFRIHIDRDMDTLFLPNRPITSVTDVQIKPVWGPQYPFILNADTMHIQGNSLVFTVQDDQTPHWDAGWMPFAEGDWVTVTYDCGFADIDHLPDDIKLASVYLLSTMLFAPADNPGGADSIRSGGTSMSFGQRGGIVNPMAMDAEQLLAPYIIHMLND